MVRKFNIWIINNDLNEIMTKTKQKKSIYHLGFVFFLIIAFLCVSALEWQLQLMNCDSLA